MPQTLRLPFRSSVLCAALTGLQAVTGLLLRDAYLDIGWSKAMWFGNDLVTLLAALPLFALALVLVSRGSTRGFFLASGCAVYAAYTGIWYLSGAALNAFFPLYLCQVLVSAFTVLHPAGIGLPPEPAGFGPRTPVRPIGWFLVLASAVLAALWLIMWASYVFAGRPTPVTPETFKLMAAADLTLLVPFLMAGGVLLWLKRPLGPVVALPACVLASLRFLVLTVNSANAVLRGYVKAPGELPVWGALFLLTGAVTLILFAGVRAGSGPGLRMFSRTASSPS